MEQIQMVVLYDSTSKKSFDLLKRIKGKFYLDLQKENLFYAVNTTKAKHAITIGDIRVDFFDINVRNKEKFIGELPEYVDCVFSCFDQLDYLNLPFMLDLVQNARTITSVGRANDADLFAHFQSFHEFVEVWDVSGEKLMRRKMWTYDIQENIHFQNKEKAIEVFKDIQKGMYQANAIEEDEEAQKNLEKFTEFLSEAQNM